MTRMIPIRAGILGGLFLAAGCPSSQTAGSDAALPDGAPGPDAAADGAGGPWRHTILIDGVNDFELAETFSTTTAGYAAYITWDADNLYVGYSGIDIAVDAPDSETKWVLVYVDLDPEVLEGGGAPVGERYNTQEPDFPSAFAPEHYYRWKSNDSFEGLRSWTGTGWTDTAIATDAAVTGEFMELALPRSTLGTLPSFAGVVTLMVNEKDLAEWTYAGLYDGSFTDGYFDADVAAIPITRWLRVDFSATLPPTDPSHMRGD